MSSAQSAFTILHHHLRLSRSSAVKIDSFAAPVFQSPAFFIPHLRQTMIRIVLRGRTGNNLFQYALGRALAEKHGVPLVLDASWFNSEGWAEVSHLLRLPIQAKVIRPFSLASRALRNYGGRHFWEFRRIPVLKEPLDDQSFDRRFRDAPANCYLFGFFQSPLYFQEIESQLRCELNELLSNHVVLEKQLLSKLTEPRSVAVHVRRQDYLYHSQLQVCDHPYYEKSMNQMRARLPGARFFVFSDDPVWCAREFNEADTEVMDALPARPNPLHDLHLMSLASHHIIANSSYSWWAAWLGKKPDQQVIIPDRWFTEGIIAPIKEKCLTHWRTVDSPGDIDFHV